MKVVMVTNAYLPQIGGVSVAVDRFIRQYRYLGHAVLVVAPGYAGQPRREPGVLRVPAIWGSNGHSFSVRWPLPEALRAAVDGFGPDVIHSHHPFLLGNAALHLGTACGLPVVFTHHTMYEEYTHYLPPGCEALKRLAVDLCTRYANLCDQVISPSASAAALLTRNGVKTPVSVIPTGVETGRFADGDGQRFRLHWAVPRDAFVAGYVGRLAPEKNLRFLGSALSRFVEHDRSRMAVVVGDGPLKYDLELSFEEAGVEDQLRLTGTLKERELIDAYHALDVLAFASKTESQALVPMEALAAGCPVVALDAPGTRDALQDADTGSLLREEDPGAFVAALEAVQSLDARARLELKERALARAERFSAETCAERALEVYERARARFGRSSRPDAAELCPFVDEIERDWRIWRSRLAAAAGPAPPWDSPGGA